MGKVITNVAEADPPAGFTVIGVIVPVIPFGKPETARLTGDENPSSDVIVTVTFADCDLLRVIELVDVDREKSVTLTVRTVDLVMKPLEAVMVKENVPRLAVPVGVTETCADAVVSGFRNNELGAIDTATPEGAPET